MIINAYSTPNLYNVICAPVVYIVWNASSCKQTQCSGFFEDIFSFNKYFYIQTIVGAVYLSAYSILCEANAISKDKYMINIFLFSTYYSYCSHIFIVLYNFLFLRSTHNLQQNIETSRTDRFLTYAFCIIL